MTRQKDGFLYLSVMAVMLLALLSPQPVQSARLSIPLAQDGSNNSFMSASAISLGDHLFGSTYGTSMEAGEPSPFCYYSSIESSVWYAYKPAVSKTVMVSLVNPYYQCVTVYTGADLTTLILVGTSSYDRQAFVAEAGKTYYIQVGAFYWSQGAFEILLDPAPDPYAELSIWANDGSQIHSFYDAITISAYYSDPAGLGIKDVFWDLWDGRRLVNENTIYLSNMPDGDYPIRLTVTTVDGRSASDSQTLTVRTHDIAISRFSLPDVGRPGLTRTVTVYMQNNRYPETVKVEFYVSVPGSWFGAPDTWRLVDTKTLSVPVRAAHQYTKVSFDYTFTLEDANLGSVNFKAVTTIVDEQGNPIRDALPADNTAISLPVRVRK